MAETQSPDDLPHWQPSPDALCARCQENPVGPGGIICPDCRAAIEAANRVLTEEGQGGPVRQRTITGPGAASS